MQTAESVEVVRCPSCGGLRGIAARHLHRHSVVCSDCRRGHVVTVTHYHLFWLERFTREEIEEMATAIWR